MHEYAGYRFSERMLEEFHLLDASAYSSVPKSKLHVVSTSSETGFPVPGVPQDVAPFRCDWETLADEVDHAQASFGAPYRMPDHVLTEEPLQFGEGGRLFGILTLPSMPPRNAQELPVFVFLSAGLLHRVGPHGCMSALPGNSPKWASVRCGSIWPARVIVHARPGLTYQQSVAADFGEILGVLESRLGRLPLVLAGLCSGAHNAIRLTLEEPRVVGMVLLDPICFPDRGFRARVVVARYTNPARYIAWLKRRFKALTLPRGKKQEDDKSADR